METVKPKAESKADAPKAKAEVDAIAKALGIERGNPMTFEEANEMRGNPNYKEDVQYRVNCQSCVVANEMRRRGYDVEAFGNTWAVNNTPNALSRKTEAAWLDTDGNTPGNTIITRKVTLGEKTIDRRGNVRVKKTKESDRELSSRIMEAMSEEGRYTIAWKWATKHSGHIITAERLADGSLRFYDPQTGKTGWTAKFKDIDTVKGFKILRVDNLQPNIDVLRGVVKVSGSNTVTPLMDVAQKAFWMKLGMGSDVVQGDDKPKHEPLSEQQKARRSEIKNIMTSNKNNTYTSNLFDSAITLPNKSIKEWLNQPHYAVDEKNETLLHLQSTLDHCTEKISIPIKPKYQESVSNAYALPINIKGRESWIIVHAMKWGEVKIHGISDNMSIFEK